MYKQYLYVSCLFLVGLLKQGWFKTELLQQGNDRPWEGNPKVWEL